MPRYVAGNSITLLKDGTDYFPALEEAIYTARREIYLETYIFADDATGRSIALALKDAALRGVTVRVIVDGFGSRDFLPDSMIADLEAAGVQLLIYRPELGRLNVRRNRLRRLHRKIVLVDAATAFVGGINVIDDMNTPNHTPPRVDFAVKVVGPLTQDIQEVTHRLWQLLSWTNFKQRLRAGPLVEATTITRGDQRAALVIRDNLGHRNDIEESYLQGINAAQREVIIACAYFFPGIEFRHALLAAAERGVRVTLLLQGRVEYLWLHHASRALYGSLLAGGIEILEYHKSFMHAKVAVVDDDWATVGSSNIDPFSFLLSREANVVVRDRAFCAQLKESLQQMIAEGSRQVEHRRWRRRPLRERGMAWIAYWLGRLTLGFLGYPQK
jgi:cardiolipin synthase A/B